MLVSCVLCKSRPEAPSGVCVCVCVCVTVSDLENLKNAAVEVRFALLSHKKKKTRYTG